MKRTAPFVALLLCLALPAAAQTVTVTGGQGGTIQKNRDCARQPGLAECGVTSVYTAPDGTTATRQRLRSTAQGTSTTSISRSNPVGETTVRNRSVLITR